MSFLPEFAEFLTWSWFNFPLENSLSSSMLESKGIVFFFIKCQIFSLLRYYPVSVLNVAMLFSLRMWKSVQVLRGLSARSSIPLYHQLNSLCPPSNRAVSSHAYSTPDTANVRLRRSFMYVPGDQRNKLVKLPHLGADCFVIDCEDAVAFPNKVALLIFYLLSPFSSISYLFSSFFFFILFHAPFFSSLCGPCFLPSLIAE